MKFLAASGKPLADPALAAEYKAARAFGNVRVGDSHLFIRSGMRNYALEHSGIRRCYRRVMRVPMKMCCGSGSLDVEHLVVEGDSGELAQVQPPGTRAAVALMELLKERMPEVEYALPPRPDAREVRA